MGKRLSQEAGRQLRLLLTVILLVAGSTVLFSFTSARLLSDDRWAHLGLNQQKTDARIKESFMYGYLQYSGMRPLSLRRFARMGWCRCGRNSKSGKTRTSRC